MIDCPTHYDNPDDIFVQSVCLPSSQVAGGWMSSHLAGSGGRSSSHLTGSGGRGSSEETGRRARYRRGPLPDQGNNCSQEEEGDTFLWRIDSKVPNVHLPYLYSKLLQPPSYFFGTIHVPYTRVWDAVSANTKKAFKSADKVNV